MIVKDSLGDFKRSIGDGYDFINQYHNDIDFNNDFVKNLTENGLTKSVIQSEHMNLGNSEVGEEFNWREDYNFNRISDRDDSLAKNAFTIKKSDINQMVSDTVLSDPETMLTNRFNRFNRYGYLDPTHELVTGAREYVFFSKPDLHLVNPSKPQEMYDVLQGVPFFREAFDHYKLSYYSLQQYFSGNTGMTSSGLRFELRNLYVNLLSNMVTSSFDLSDISASDVLNNQNLYQINTSYREGSLSSDLQYDFSLEFKDTKYLDVYMFFKIYDEYFRTKYMLEIEPTRRDYIMAKVYPEAMSIWKVIVDDSSRIIYWAKATGATPMSVPRGTISNFESNIKFTINWKAQFIRDMDPVNLLELNYLTAKSLGVNFAKGSSIANAVLGKKDIVAYPESTNKTWVGYPLIVSDGNGVNSVSRTGHVGGGNRSQFYRLIWVDNSNNV